MLPQDDSAESTSSTGGFCLKCFLTALFAGLSSALLLSIGLASLFFLIPLQIAAIRRGARAFTGATVFAILITTAILLFQGAEAGFLMAYSGSLGMLVALWVMNINLFGERFNWPAWIRISLGGAIAGASLLMMFSFADRSGLLEVLEGAISGSQDFENAILSMFPGYTLSEIVVLVREMMYRMVFFSGLLSLALAYGLGHIFGGGVQTAINRIGDFRMPDGMIWTVISSGVALLAGEYFGISILAYIGWNAILFTLFLYVILGVAILAMISRRKPALRLFFPAILVISIIIPVLNFASSILFGVLGMSSIWIRYSDGTGVAGSADKST